MAQPNVWFIMMDQARWDALGCYGNTICETPNLDYFADQGTVFQNCYTPTPTCAPTRSTLLTGKDPWNVGVMYRDPDQGPPDLGETFPKVLSEAGYHTQCVGSVGPGAKGALHGFHDVRRYDPDYADWFKEHSYAGSNPDDRNWKLHSNGLGPNSWMSRPWNLPEHLHRVSWTAQESIRFLKRRDHSKPFFLKTSFLAPHAPYDPPQYFYDLYDNKEIPEAIAGDWAHADDKPTKDPDAMHGRLGAEQERRAKVGYYASISFIDNQIGVVRQYLKKQGLLDNTLIVFLSDHGDMMGDHHLWRKGYAYEGSAHVPFIVSLPKDMRKNIQQSSNAPVCHQDIMPTILEICNAPIPDGVDGKSVLPLIQGKDTNWRDYIHGEHRQFYRAENEHHYLTDTKWKYIWFPQINTEQLFHLEDDPYELTDLAQNPEYEKVLLHWRNWLIKEIEPRNVGLVENGKLICQEGKPAPISPHYKGVAN